MGIICVLAIKYCFVSLLQIMMCFLIRFLPLLGLLLASTPIHLKPGALSTHLGRVAFVEHVLLVPHLFASLLTIMGNLDVVSANLQAALVLVTNDFSLYAIGQLTDLNMCTS